MTVHWCEQCQLLREAYRNAILEVACLERRKSSLESEARQDLTAQLELAEQARKAARDALNTHQTEKGHS
jgi:hypothetical protein